MKCKNCGGNYSARDIKCPYCGTDNPIGKLWKQQREQAELAYHTASTEELPVIRKRMANKVLNRILLVEAILFILLIVGIFLSFFFAEGFQSVKIALNRQDLEAEMATLYKEDRFDELYLLLEEENLFGEEYYAYSQMSLLYYEYSSYRQYRMTFFEEAEQAEMGEYTMEWLIGSMNEILNPYIPAYPDLTEANAEHLEVYQQDVEVFARAVLGMNDTEIETLSQDYLSLEEEEVLIAAVMERRYWDAE